jgi:hypothetical protein
MLHLAAPGPRPSISQVVGPRVEVLLALQRPLLAEQQHAVSLGDLALAGEVSGFKDGTDEVN